jgi:hypothetical protein
MAERHRKTKKKNIILGTVAHSCAGRTRLNFAALKDKTAVLASLCDQVRQISAVVDAEIRSLTGSLIIAHWGTTDDLIEDAQRNGLFAVRPETEVQTVEAHALGLVEGLESLTKEVLGRELDIRSLAAFAFIAIAIRQIGVGAIAPPAATALWYAATLLLAGKGLVDMTGNGGPDTD